MQLLIFFQIDLITLFLLKIISMYQKSQHAIRNQKINSCTASYEWLITLLLDLNLSVLWWIDYWNICKCRVFSTENIRDFFLLYVLAQNTSQREVWSTWLSGHMR